MNIQEQLERIQSEATLQMEKIRDKSGLEEVRLRVLGKKGELTQLLRSMGQLPAEERPAAGQMINKVRETITQKLDEMDSYAERALSNLSSRLSLEPVPGYIPAFSSILSLPGISSYTRSVSATIFSQMLSGLWE